MEDQTDYLGPTKKLDLEDLAHRLAQLHINGDVKSEDIVAHTTSDAAPLALDASSTGSPDADTKLHHDLPSAPPSPDETSLKDLIAQLRLAAADPEDNLVRSVFGLDKQGFNAREHKLTEDMSEEHKNTRARKKHRKENRRLLEEALKPDHIIRVPELDIQHLLNADQTRHGGRPYPTFDTNVPVRADKGPICVVDAKDVPIVFVFPKCLTGPSHNYPYDSLLSLGSKVAVKVRNNADVNTRDACDSYTRTRHAHERHGVFQLVTLWNAIGRTADIKEPGPSTDFIHSVKDYNASLHAIQELNILSARIDSMFKLIDPKQYDQLRQASDSLKALYPSYAATAHDDITFFHGRSIIYNRETPEHADRLDPKVAWTPLVTLGKYTSGTLRVAGLDIDYLPGSIVFIRGGIVRHQVTFEGGQRIAIAHFTHRDLLLKVNVPILNICTLDDVRQSLERTNTVAADSHGGGRPDAKPSGDVTGKSKRKRSRSRSARSVRANASRVPSRASSPPRQ